MSRSTARLEPALTGRVARSGGAAVIPIRKPLVARLVDELSQGGAAVTRFRVPAGQDLLYAGHLPTGAMFLLSGEVGRFAADGRLVQRLRPSSDGCPVVLVPIAELKRPCAGRLHVLKRSELLHVGCSSCLPGGSFQRRVRRLERALEPKLAATR